MNSSFFTTLRFKIAAFIIILLLVSASIFSLLTIQTMNRHILDEVLKRSESLCKSTAGLAPYSMLSNDLLGIDNIVAKVKEANTDVDFVAVTDSQMKILAHTDMTKRGSPFHRTRGEIIKETEDGARIVETRERPSPFFEISAPIAFNGKTLGTVIIGANKSVLLAAQADTRNRILFGLGIAITLGIACIIVLSSFLTRPIKELSKGVGELKGGKRTKLRIYSHDELGKLTEGFNQMAELITRQRASLSASARELEDSYISTVKVLAAAIDARDPYTLGHSTRVSKLSVKIGENLGLSAYELENLEIASLFHDVGKLKTPDYVLLKGGSLNPLEHHEMSEHPEHGAAILSRAKSLHKYIPAVRHHHEWYNGEGYPDGLQGEDIPLHAAIIAVADAFDAMTSSRPYKNPRNAGDALRELARFSGKQFDPRIVDAFGQVINEEPTLAEHAVERE
jgi:putative nucleotidyltransferase with HDIG domain